MRLAVDLRSLLETGGKISGVENYVANATGHLQHKKGIELLFFYNSFKRAELPKAFQHFGDVKKSSIPNKILNLALKLGFPKFENLYGPFDALWLPDLRPFAIGAKTKLVLTVHDLSPVVNPEFYSLRRRIWHSLLNYGKSFRRADLIFAVSEYTKQDLIKIFSINPEKIKVVYPGIEHHLFNTNLDQRLKHKVREKYNLPAKYILSLSTVEPRKNLESLVEAFEKLEDSEAHLVIAGRLGWLYQSVLEKVNNSSKKDRIKLLGYVPETDKPYLISQAVMLCYPSFYEGFGFQPLEAMACGVPVLASARTSVPEVCGDAALLVEPYHLEDIAEGMRSLLADQRLRDELIEKGLQRSKKFSWQNTSEQIFKQLENL